MLKIKLVVPSSGSINHLIFSSEFLILPLSSAWIFIFGCRDESSLIIVFSALISALDTKSETPFKETCSFSTSPKSLMSATLAFLDAAKIELINGLNSSLFSSFRV